MNLHLLVIEGNTRADRETYRVGFDMTASEAYAATLREIAPDAICEICFPADKGAGAPDAAGLESYDGVFITGSALNLYDGGAAITRQIELARAVFASRTPFFGLLLGLAGRDRRRGRRRVAQSEGPRDRLRPQHFSD